LLNGGRGVVVASVLAGTKIVLSQWIDSLTQYGYLMP
jgi:hypothetical protein